jgi:hypothetical protein
MSTTYPPESSKPNELLPAINALASVIDGRSATYVSAPLTTGKRFLNTSSNSDAQSFGNDLLDHLHVKSNREAARVVVASSRRISCHVVIDPTVFEDVPGWTQDDYRTLWGQVIERFASRVVFVDGWQYSSGCSYEFLVAQRTGAHCLDERMQDLSPVEGLALIRQAIAEYHRVGVVAGILEPVAADLSWLFAAEAVSHE